MAESEDVAREREYLTEALAALRTAAVKGVVTKPEVVIKAKLGVGATRASEMQERLVQLGLCSVRGGSFRVRKTGVINVQALAALMRGEGPQVPERPIEDPALLAKMREWVSKVVQSGDVWELRETATSRVVLARLHVKGLEVVGEGKTRAYRVALIRPVEYHQQLATPGRPLADTIKYVDGDVFYGLATRRLLVLSTADQG